MPRERLLAASADPHSDAQQFCRANRSCPERGQALARPLRDGQLSDSMTGHASLHGDDLKGCSLAQTTEPADFPAVPTREHGER